jgi:cell division septation protein DedD
VTDLSHDAPDDGFHEIQLSGKQLVFLFMATTVVSVVIFLCGVLVGRGVRGEPVATLNAAGNSTTPPVTMSGPSSSPPAAPPSEAPTPGDPDLTYKGRLESETTPSETLKSRKADASPAPTAGVTPPPVVDTPAAPAPIEAPVPAKQPEKTEKPLQKPAPTVDSGVKKSGIWAVQVVALTDQAAADAVVRRLSSKGYPAFLVRPQATSPVQNYKVQVGKFDDRSEAEQVAGRLKREEQFQPWILR